MLRIAAAAALVFGLTLFTSGAAAETSRGCSASVFIDTDGKSEAMATLEGRGFCKNRFRANQCRERARGAIVTCLRELWDGRWRDGLPASCIISGGGRPWAKLTWLQGPPPRLNSLTNRAIWFACCKMRPSTNSLAYVIHAGVGGDKGCGSGFAISPVSAPIGLECKQLRDSGFCAPR